MRKSDKIQIVVVMIIWILVFIGSKYSRAEQVYNFYFNPEDNSTEKTHGKTPEVISTGISDTKRTKVGNSVAGSTIGLLEPGMLRFGTYATAFSSTQSVYDYQTWQWNDYYKDWVPWDKEIGHKRKERQEYGFSLALDFFPVKYLGLSSQLAIGEKDREQFGILSGAFSTKIIPLHFGLFSRENIFELGGEFGYSTYKYHSGKVKRFMRNFDRDESYDYAESPTLEGRLFYGGISRVNLVKNIYLDLALRRYIQFPIWQANAGLSYSF